MKAFNTAQRPETKHRSRAPTRREIERNTAPSKVATETRLITCRLLVDAIAQRLLSTMLDPVNEKGAVDTTATMAKDHHTVRMRLAHLSPNSAPLARTKNRIVPRHVVVVANELITWTRTLHR